MHSRYSVDSCASGQRAGVAHRRAGRGSLRGMEDGVRVDAVVAIEVLNRAGLAEMLDTGRLDQVAMDTTEPGECCRMSVDDGDDGAIAGERREKAPLMMPRAKSAVIARPGCSTGRVERRR